MISILQHSQARQATCLAAGLMASVLLLWQWATPAAAGTAVQVPSAARTLEHSAGQQETAVLAGGCFWGMETVFEHVRGVTNVVSGYAGGSADTATYQASSTGNTDHAESVRITFDSDQIAYTDLLRIYFSVAHDPTQVNRQGPDVGREYRSEIFALNEGQARVARAYIEQLSSAQVFDKPIATKVSRLSPDAFYKAESYHQNYAERNPNSRYIVFVDKPKVDALKEQFSQRYRERPQKLSSAG